MYQTQGKASTSLTNFTIKQQNLWLILFSDELSIFLDKYKQFSSRILTK